MYIYRDSAPHGPGCTSGQSYRGTTHVGSEELNTPKNGNHSQPTGSGSTKGVTQGTQQGLQPPASYPRTKSDARGYRTTAPAPKARADA